MPFQFLEQFLLQFFIMILLGDLKFVSNPLDFSLLKFKIFRLFLCICP